MEAGETVAVLGPNGAGKTSLGRGIMGLTPHEGRLLRDGIDISRLRSHQRARSGLSYVPSSARTFPNLTVAQNVEIGAGNREKTWGVIAERFPILREKAKQPAGQLSGGQQQLLSIARALALEPAYLILDEPSAGLAPVAVEEVFEILRGLTGAAMGVLLLEQNAVLGVELADRCLVLSGGRVRLAGSSAELAGSPVLEELYLGGGQDLSTEGTA